MEGLQGPDRIIVQLDVMEVHLNFCLNVDVCAWSDLSCEADFVGAMTLMRDKCPFAAYMGSGDEGEEYGQ